MKIILTGLTIQLIILFSGVYAQDTISDRTLTVMTWNIWQGGKGERLPVEDARPEVIQIIKQTGADVVLMIETYGAAPLIAETLGFEYFLISDNLCVFSRYPIVETYRFPDLIAPFNFGGVKIIIEEQAICLFDTWLHYLPDTRLVPTDSLVSRIIAWERSGSRDEEIEAAITAMLPFIENAYDVPVIVGGDFNSHSHLDWIIATQDTFHHGGVSVSWPVSVAMAEAGFTDAYRAIHPDPISHPGTTWLPVIKNEKLVYERQDRIDYLYYQGEKLEPVHCEAHVAPDGTDFDLDGQKFMFPSDHGFVLTRFVIQP